MKKYIIVIVLLCIFIALVLFWGYSILKCEILTSIHKDEFDKIYQTDTMIGEIDCLKILQYNDSYSKVYFVSKDHSSGHIVTFIKEPDNWCVYKWETIWSKSGSAEGFVWPYIR